MTDILVIAYCVHFVVMYNIYIRFSCMYNRQQFRRRKERSDDVAMHGRKKKYEGKYLGVKDGYRSDI
jgi:hypothetical protein